MECGNSEAEIYLFVRFRQLDNVYDMFHLSLQFTVMVLFLSAIRGNKVHKMAKINITKDRKYATFVEK